VPRIKALLGRARVTLVVVWDSAKGSALGPGCFAAVRLKRQHRGIGEQRKAFISPKHTPFAVGRLNPS